MTGMETKRTRGKCIANAFAGSSALLNFLVTFSLLHARSYALRGIAKASCPYVCNVEVSWQFHG